MLGSPNTRPAPDLPVGRRLALVVATTRYTDTSLRQLRAPAQDAADLCDLLADPHIGGFTVTSVVDEPAQQIRLAIEGFLIERHPDDLLLVYLSCHGLVDPRRRLYFAATDTLKNRLAATAVESQWVLDQLDDCRARQQVVILDCCFSGAFAHGAKGDTDLGLGERFHGQGRGRVVLTASRASEYSFEGEPVAGSTMPGSVFTSALVAGIRTGAADMDNDGYICVDDAYAYTFDRIRTADAQQTPQRWLYGAEGTILLARSPAGVTIIPEAIPDVLRAGLDSPHPSIRLGAVAAIGEWLAEGDPARELAARNTLRQVADADIPRVAAAAKALLERSPLPDTATGDGVSPAADSLAKKAPVPTAPDAARATLDTSIPGPERATRRKWSRRRWLAYVAIALAVLVIAGFVVALRLMDGGNPRTGGGSSTGDQFTATAPWRLVIDDRREGMDGGCDVTVTNIDTNEQVKPATIYGTRSFQMHGTGTFRWEANDPGCRIIRRPGPGEAVLPFAQQPYLGDTDAFAAPKAPGKIVVQLVNFDDTECDIELRDIADGRVLDFGTLHKDGLVTLDPNGRSLVYLADLGCGVQISAG